MTDAELIAMLRKEGAEDYVYGEGADPDICLQASRRIEALAAGMGYFHKRLEHEKSVRAKAVEVCRILDAAVLEGHGNVQDLLMHLLSAVEPARAVLAEIAAEQNETKP